MQSPPTIPSSWEKGDLSDASSSLSSSAALSSHASSDPRGGPHASSDPRGGPHASSDPRGGHDGPRPDQKWIEAWCATALPLLSQVTSPVSRSLIQLDYPEHVIDEPDPMPRAPIPHVLSKTSCFPGFINPYSPPFSP